ncbi:MAG TPA: carbon-nitrogen hydrolase family protein [Longimicrobium sp.]|nr:carbon-nitrogen hydrolase family protein [Longimicrobium sp.]
MAAAAGRMKVAAWQAPLPAGGVGETLELVRARVRQCEAQGIAILCCPEAVLGGLADYAEEPDRLAIPASRLDHVLAPLASQTVATLVGFTERAADGGLYNAAAVFHRGAVAGVYRKLHPAINRSVYRPGREIPVFAVDGLTFGIVICNDSNFVEPARLMAAQGAAALFVPTSNGLPPSRAYPGLVDEARRADIARAVENGVWVIRADVAGSGGGLVSHGSSGIVDPEGSVVRSARRLGEDLLVAEIRTTAPARRSPAS